MNKLRIVETAHSEVKRLKQSQSLPMWAIVIPLSAVAVFGLFCLTVYQLKPNNLCFRLEALGIKLDAEVGACEANIQKTAESSELN